MRRLDLTWLADTTTIHLARCSSGTNTGDGVDPMQIQAIGVPPLEALLFHGRSNQASILSGTGYSGVRLASFRVFWSGIPRQESTACTHQEI